MARRTDLRKFQESLIERLQGSTQAESLSAKLGVMIGDDAWLVDLTSISEVLPVPELEPVPHARRWLIGIANIRGHLYSVTDMGLFQDQPRVEIDETSRVLLLNPKLIRGAALLVTSTVGLRHHGQLTSESPLPGVESPWIQALHHDREYRRWRELDVARLVTDAKFLEVSEQTE
jgi:twitching motility protein PilI